MPVYDGTSTGTTPGIKGTSPSGVNIPGVVGNAQSSAHGVLGTTVTANYAGVAGASAVQNAYGVYAETTGGGSRAVYAYATGSGSTAVYAKTTGNYCFRGENTVGAYGIFVTAAVAGYFSGSCYITGQCDVWGNLWCGGIFKSGGSFLIDHPQDPANQYLEHSFVESPERKNIYDGIVTADASGEVTVTLPKYFESLNTEFRYQLTAIGKPAPNLHIKEEIKGNAFTIAGAAPGQRVAWQVTGNRQDEWAKANPLVVEREKPKEEKGKYRNPELFGKTKADAIFRPEPTDDG